ncbi:MAG: hypothetical protein AB1899_16805 [Pseudomonadota bacterium]
MKRRAAAFLSLILRGFLALSLACLPAAQAWAMADLADDAPPPCHAMADDGPSPQQSDGDCTHCHGQCHCLAALALPRVSPVQASRPPAVWDAWIPLPPDEPAFAPTAPPPRA